MNRTRSFALALALVSAGLVAGCDKKKNDAASKTATPTAPAAPAPTAPAPTAPSPSAPAPAAEAPGAPTDGVKLARAVYTVGLHWTKTDDMTSDMQISAGDKKIAITERRHRKDELEVLEVDAAGLVTKMKASYPERQDTEEVGGKARDKASPLAGKSYVVSSAGGKVSATLADGGAVSAAEVAELTHDLDELGKPQPMDEIMAARTWKVGEPYTFTADDLAKLAAVRDAEAPDTTSMVLTLREVHGTQAIFDMKSELKTAGKAAMTIAMTGAVTLDVATGHPSLVELSGPVTGSVNGMPVTGTMGGKTTYAFAP